MKVFNEQYLRLNVMKIFICMSEFETKNLQPRILASLQIKVHYCKLDLKYFLLEQDTICIVPCQKFFSSMVSFQQEMLISERHKNIYNKLTETGIFG